MTVTISVSLLFINVAIHFFKLYDKLGLSFPKFIAAHLWIIFVLGTFWGVFSIISKNRAYRQTFEKIHKINHFYREKLAHSSLVLLAASKLEQEEVTKFLHSVQRTGCEKVCSYIKSIFEGIVGTEVHITLWLYQDSVKSCEIFTSTDDRREAGTTVQISDCEYLQFDKTSSKNHPHAKSYFHQNTKKAKSFLDGFPESKEFYKSILVIPIHFEGKINDEILHDRLGFLQADCKSANHLNNREHAELLAAFADQFYNFLSIMKQNYYVINVPQAKHQ